MFRNRSECDFYFVTHQRPHKDALQFCPKTSWAETRNVLAEKVPKEYEYYAFVDHDYVLRTRTPNNPREQILHDLKIYQPAILIPYPGKGNVTPLAQNDKYWRG